MGLNYGEAERRGGDQDAGFSRGRRDSSGVKISVDSMKLKYEDGWVGEAVSAT